MDIVAATRFLAALIVIALVLAGMHFALRSSGRRGRRRGRFLRIVDTVFLPGAASLHVVAIASRHLIIGRGAAQITLLGELPESEAVSLTERA